MVGLSASVLVPSEYLTLQPKKKTFKQYGKGFQFSVGLFRYAKDWMKKVDISIDGVINQLGVEGHFLYGSILVPFFRG